MKPLTVCFLFALLLSSCFPDDLAEQMGEAMKQSQAMMVDKNFTTSVNYIELHKLRTGSYPDSLSQILHVNEFDKGSFTAVEYRKLENGYELNMRVLPANVAKYGSDYWIGLGCVKSNMMLDSVTVSADSLVQDSVVSQQ